jgi:DNA adenine methylase
MKIASPFVKWAGGKGRLISQLESYFPPQLKSGKIKKFFEPFVGGGAVFLHIAQTYKIDRFYIFDINHELINVYRTIKYNVEELIESLNILSTQYKHVEEIAKPAFYYNIRDQYNRELDNQTPQNCSKAAQLIFLNKTCYNGLFRVNSKGKFNVPFGKHIRPNIFDPENLRGISEILQRTEIFIGSYNNCEMFIDDTSFVYFDPPYRAIGPTENFNSYNSVTFTNQDQIDLSHFFWKLHNDYHAMMMLSNSDPQSTNPEDNFFNEYYLDSWSTKVKIKASRFINCDPSGRGSIDELLIINYTKDGNLIDKK